MRTSSKLYFTPALLCRDHHNTAAEKRNERDKRDKRDKRHRGV